MREPGCNLTALWRPRAEAQPVEQSTAVDTGRVGVGAWKHVRLYEVTVQGRVGATSFAGISAASRRPRASRRRARRAGAYGEDAIVVIEPQRSAYGPQWYINIGVFTVAFVRVKAATNVSIAASMAAGSPDAR
jgi:hypothetical protein